MLVFQLQQPKTSTDTKQGDMSLSIAPGHGTTTQDPVKFEAVRDKDTPVPIGPRTQATGLIALAEDPPAR